MEKAIFSRYVSEDIRVAIQNNPNIKKNNTYPFLEVEESAFWLTSEIEGAISALVDLHSIVDPIYYLLVSSEKPFQSVFLKGQFILVFDWNALNHLMDLSFRVQSLDPLSKFLRMRCFQPKGNYADKFLIDIVRDFLLEEYDPELFVPSFVHRGALAFIIAHEIAHIIHGHLDFKLCVEEFSKFSQDDEDKNLTLRTLEMDADSSATTSVYAICESMIRYNLRAGKYNDVKDYTELMRARYITGIYVSWLYLDARSSSNVFPKTHPVNYSRFLSSQNVLQQVYLKDLSDPENALIMPDKVRNALVQAFTKLNGQINKLGHPMAINCIITDEAGNNHHLYDELVAEIALENIYMLGGRWAKLSPVLKKYLRAGKLADPYTDPI